MSVSAIGDGVPVRGGRDRVRMAVVGEAVAMFRRTNRVGVAGIVNAVGMCPAVARIFRVGPCIGRVITDAANASAAMGMCLISDGMVVPCQGVPIQRRTLNADSGSSGPGPDVQCAVPDGYARLGVPGSPAGCGGAEADSRLGASGGDAGGSRCRAAGCAGLIGFSRPEDETVGQVGGAVGAVAQRPPRGDGACGAGPHADEARRDDFLKPVQELRECHQRTPQRPAKLGTVSLSLSLSLSLSHGYFLLQFHDEAQGVVGRQGAHGLCRECVGVPAVGDGVPMRGGRDRVRMAVVGDAVAVLG